MFGKPKSTASTTESRTKVGTLIGEGAVFDGNLSAPESVRIDGTVNGNCTCEKELIIGTQGRVEGNISAQNVVISGKVNGDISVRGKLELLSTGKIVGDIVARSLVIDEDAYFDGRCTMTTANDSSAASPAQSAMNRLSEVSSEASSENESENHSGSKRTKGTSH